jgi:putative hydrolase
VGEKDNTRAIINAIQRGEVDIITHLYREQFPVDIRETVLCAKEYSVMLELNKFVLLSAIKKKDNSLITNLNKMIEFIAETKAICIFGSDAHHISEMGVSDLEWDLLCGNFNISGVELCNNDITLLENMWNTAEVI